MTEETTKSEANDKTEGKSGRWFYPEVQIILGAFAIMVIGAFVFAFHSKAQYADRMIRAEAELSEAVLEGPSDWLSYAEYTSAARVELGSEVVSAVLVSTPKTDIHAQGLVCVATRSGEVRPTVVRSSAQFEEDLKGPYLDRFHDISDFTKDELTSFCGELLQESSSYLHQMR